MFIERKRLQAFIIILIGFFALLICAYDLYGTTINVGDYSWPFNHSIQSARMVFPYDDSYNNGYVAARQPFGFYIWGMMFWLSDYFGIQNSASQNIFYIFCYIIGIAGSYKLSLYLWNDRITALIVSIIYSFGPAQITLSQPAMGNIMPFYLIMPMASYLFIRFVESENYKYVLFSLVLPINLVFTNPAYLVSMFLFFIMYIYVVGISQQKLKLMLVFLLLTILFNSNGVLPFVDNLTNEFDSASNSTISIGDDIAVAKGDSIQVASGLVGIGWSFWAVVGGQDGWDYTTWGPLFNSLLVKCVWSIFFFFGLFFLLKVKEQKTRRMLMAYFISVLLVSGLKSIGFLDFVMNALYSNQFFARMYRSNFIKLGFANQFFAILIFAIGLHRIRNFWIIIPILIMFLYPKLTFQSYRPIGNDVPSERIRLPEEYKLLHGLNLHNYILLPDPTTYNVALKWSDSSYIGAEFIRTLVHGNQVKNKETIRTVTECMAANVDCNLIIQSNDVQSIIIRNDIDFNQRAIWNHVDYQKYKNILESVANNQDAKKTKYFTLLNFHELENDKNLSNTNEKYKNLHSFTDERILSGLYVLNSNNDNSLVTDHSGWSSQNFNYIFGNRKIFFHDSIIISIVGNILSILTLIFVFAKCIKK